MRKLLPLLLLSGLNAQAQTHPVVYINFTSHNEQADNLQNPLNYNVMKTKVIQLAGIMNSKGAAWNLETCDGFPKGAVAAESNYITSSVFKTITSGVYADNIEIDPRPKVIDTNTFNIADTYRLLDTMGCNPTATLGGFVYASANQSQQQIDWFRYQDTIVGKQYPWVKWKANLMWGAGSFPPHTNDLNDWGIWKPDMVSYTTTEASFRVHNPNNTVWYVGNGCQPIYALDSLEDYQQILNPLRSFIDSLQHDLLPQNRFYVYSITINQSQFGPTLFSKISAVCDSINNWGTTKVQWANLSEKFDLFQAWQSTSGETSSMWNCNQSWLDVVEDAIRIVSIYPNPAIDELTVTLSDASQHSYALLDALGHEVQSGKVQGKSTIDIGNLNCGMYFIRIDQQHMERFIVNR